MNTNNCVLDISSDEEIDVKDQQVNLEWFCDQLFKDVVDDSDDVVVVGEVPSSNQIADKLLSSDEKKGKEVEEEEDDDCVVLDGDPDKMVSVEENQDDGSDELVVVGEKGQVACRDYPHPRHLCVKYPFSSTLHKFHCELCHCYVCDTVAPCNLWGTGMSIVDHCHATDKQEGWKTERKNFKLKRCSSLPALKMPKSPSSSVPLPSTVSTHIPNQLHSLSRSMTMPINHFPLRSMPSVTAVRAVLSPPTFPHMPSGSPVRPLPSAPNLNAPNIMNPRSGSYRLPHCAVSQQQPGGYSKYVGQRARYQNATGLAPQSVPFKRTRTGVAYQAAYQSGYGHLQPSISPYAPSTTRDRPVGGESVNRVNHPHHLRNPGSNMNNRAVHKPLPQSSYVNKPRMTAVYQGGMSNQPATLSTQNANQQVAYPSFMIPDVSVPWVDSTNSFLPQWDQPLQAEFASNRNASNIWADKMNTNSRQWDQPQPQPTEVSSTPNTLTPQSDNSNSGQVDDHLQPKALGVQVPQSMNPAPNYLHIEHSDDQASAVPELEDLRFEFEDWLMDNQSAVRNPSEPPFFSDQNILSPDDAHIDTALLDEWNLLANVDDIDECSTQ